VPPGKRENFYKYGRGERKWGDESRRKKIG
jgi:hypothetical protein